VQNANVRPTPLSGGTVTAVVQRRHQPRRTRNGALRGVSPHYSCGPMDNVLWARVQHRIRRPAFDAVRPQGRARKMAGRVACSYAASASSRLLQPDPSLAYGVLRKPVWTARSTSVSAHAQSGCSHLLPSEPQGPCGGSAAATRSNAPSSDENCSGWVSCSLGSRAVERNALIQDWYSPQVPTITRRSRLLRN